jgi:hypothetical protein
MSLKKNLIFLCGFFLVGCQSIQEGRIECPKAAIVAEFLKTVHFHNNEVVLTEIDSLSPVCMQEGDHIRMDLHLRLTSRRKLAKSHKPFAFTTSYFVAVVNPQGIILSRTDHDVEFAFKEKETTVVNFQNLLETVPSQNMTVYVGFNLDEHQHAFLEKNRNKYKIQRINSEKTPLASKDSTSRQRSDKP